MDCDDMIMSEEPNLSKFLNFLVPPPGFPTAFENGKPVDEQVAQRKEGGKRGRKPGRKASTEKIDIRAKLERSRQSARECRARKKLRYQYLEELVADREKAVLALRAELDRYKLWSAELNEGRLPDGFQGLLEEMGVLKQE